MIRSCSGPVVPQEWGKMDFQSTNVLSTVRTDLPPPGSDGAAPALGLHGRRAPPFPGSGRPHRIAGTGEARFGTVVAAPAHRSRRSRVADTIEHGDGYACAGRSHGVPVMPPGSNVPVFGEVGTFQVTGPGAGKLRM